MLCPSGQPDMEDAHIFGIVGGSAEQPRIAYLKRNARVTDDMLDQLGDLQPTHVFRFAARCENGRCAQFKDGGCSLGQRIAELLPPVTETLPSCQIRPSCRWFAEQGGAACLRCPQVVTLVPAGEDELAKAALPRA